MGGLTIGKAQHMMVIASNSNWRKLFQPHTCKDVKKVFFIVRCLDGDCDECLTVSVRIKLKMPQQKAPLCDLASHPPTLKARGTNSVPQLQLAVVMTSPQHIEVTVRGLFAPVCALPPPPPLVTVPPRGCSIKGAAAVQSATRYRDWVPRGALSRPG